ncbi:ABC transporter permease [Tengunoibacter tsumagoiensis]|uniref:ABC transporter permease n=1 Tax=Tengunoibacter tsumagoiensis TaxID=2014871 RepID=A0A402A3K0_9CHLR|nr:ABC transporter permease [Tengunoibacter tsumagoiensis]GCE13730.1 ABC transporter permease [Tengunoibacter tsumagoiensis]
MVQFLIKRLIGLLFVILVVTFLTFIIGYAAPGNPIQVLLGDHPNKALEAKLMHDYGLDLPWYQQYANFLIRLLHFDLGTSFKTINRPVWAILSDGVPISAELGFWALLLQIVIGVPLGVISAIRANTWVDTLNMGVALIVYAVPLFVLGILAQFVIIWIDKNTGLTWPSAQWGNPWQYSWNDIQYKLVPILVYAAAGMAYFSRIARTSMLEVLRQDYVRTARAKGLSERLVNYRHAFRNALIPLITVLGTSIGFLVGGAFFVEYVFSIPGIARITIDSINNLDYPVVQGTTIILAVGVVLGNLISDLLYTVVDPRIKAE